MRLPQHHLRSPLPGIAVALPLLFLAWPAHVVPAAESTGEQIFREQCARCHGKAGEGTDDNYPDPLAGDKSIAQLTKLIHETMPEDEETKVLRGRFGESCGVYLRHVLFGRCARAQQAGSD